MPFGGLLSLAGPALSAGSALGGIFGGTPAQSVMMPQQYNMANMYGADNSAYQGTQQLGQYNVPAQLLPQYQQIAQQNVNNPYAQQYQQGAGTAGQFGMGAGQGMYDIGGQIAGQAAGGLPDVQALLAMGFDPQNALYARTQQQLQEQTRASQAARGIQTSPYGAGLENKAMSDFNIDWQNNQLQRGVQGAQGAGNLLNSLGQGAAGGLGLQAGAGQTYMQGAGTPYGTFQGINANALQTLAGAGQFGLSASQIPQMQIQDYLAYLGHGTSQQGANNQTGQLGLNQANMGFNQQQTLGSNLGSSLAGLSKNNQGWNTMGSWFA